MNIYDRLNGLRTIEDSYLKWGEYREELTEYILSHSHSIRNIAIFGAGKCSDIDLQALHKHGIYITIIDNDMAAMKQAQEFYSIRDMNMLQKDFLGISAESYRRYGDALYGMARLNGQHTDISILADMALSMLNNMYEEAFKNVPDFGKDLYDMVLCAGVCSQINNMAAWIWEAFAKNLGDDDDRVHQYISDQNGRAVKRFHDAVIKSAGKSAVFVNELSRYGIDGSVEGAYQAISDLNARKEQCHYQEEILYWDFDKAHHVKYKMLLQHLILD